MVGYQRRKSRVRVVTEVHQYFKKEKELHIIDEKENRIIFDLEKDVYSQIEKLNIFYKEYRKKIS